MKERDRQVIMACNNLSEEERQDYAKRWVAIRNGKVFYVSIPGALLPDMLRDFQDPSGKLEENVCIFFVFESSALKSGYSGASIGFNLIPVTKGPA